MASADDLQLRVMALELVARGGKRLRPALLLLTATVGNARDMDRLLPAAAALELIHVASLYHDDVMDRAPLRRGSPSVNARWGNTMATLAGTYLFARACAVLSMLGPEANRIVAEATAELCAGQVRELENAYNVQMEEALHFDILAKKTATLFELPCRLGALLSGADEEHLQAAAEYGRSLGVAFQLTDDALDLTGEVDETGKATGTDVREGIYSLAVLRTLRRNDAVAAELRLVLSRACLSNTEVLKARRLVRDTGAVSEALDEARAYAARALAAARELPVGPARMSLIQLASYAVERSR
jgi:geranylgeranyl pyrophosphate synthase